MVRRCVDDYEMISPGDRIAVGVSGGKDSLVLLSALAHLRRYYPAPFQLEAITVDAGFPGMKVLQYAFDWTESSYYLSYNHIKNCVVYTGTHDNTTTRAWIEELNDRDRDFARRFINSENTDYGRFVWDFIREAYRSVADLCIIPLQDYLVKGKEARINEPGTLGTNWQWRLIPNYLSSDLARSIYGLAKLYGRLPKEPVKEKEQEAAKK